MKDLLNVLSLLRRGKHFLRTTSRLKKEPPNSKHHRKICDSSGFVQEKSLDFKMHSLHTGTRYLVDCVKSSSTSIPPSFRNNPNRYSLEMLGRIGLSTLSRFSPPLPCGETEGKRRIWWATHAEGRAGATANEFAEGRLMPAAFRAMTLNT